MLGGRLKGGGVGAGAAAAVSCWQRRRLIGFAAAFEPVLRPFLRRGLLDPLAPLDGTASLLARARPRVSLCLLAHLEAQRATGSLQLGSAERAAQLVLGTVRLDLEGGERWLPLVRCGVAALEQLLGVAAGDAAGAQPAAADAALLRRLLSTVVRRGSLAALEALRAAGFRPAVYRDARLPRFLRPSEPDRVLPVLDPFDFYDPAHSAVLGLPTAGAYSVHRPSERCAG